MLLRNCPAGTRNIAVITLQQAYFDAKININDIKSYFVSTGSDFKLQTIKKNDYAGIIIIRCP